MFLNSLSAIEPPGSLRLMMPQEEQPPPRLCGSLLVAREVIPGGLVLPRSLVRSGRHDRLRSRIPSHAQGDSRPSNRRSGAIDSSQSLPLSATIIPYCLQRLQDDLRMGRKGGDVEVATQPEPLAHARQCRVVAAAGEVRGRVNVRTSRPPDGEPQGVLHAAARHFVVADDGRKDGKAGGIG